MSGGDSDRFEITDRNHLNMVSAAADRATYTVTIAATGDAVFEDGNNRRTVEVVLGGVTDARQAPDLLPFVTTWRTETANQTITIPLIGSGMTIRWSDGTNSTDVSGAATHRYANPGTYRVSVHGGLEAINLGGHLDAAKLTSIDQWGDTSWTTMASAFRIQHNQNPANHSSTKPTPQIVRRACPPSNKHNTPSSPPGPRPIQHTTPPVVRRACDPSNPPTTR